MTTHLINTFLPRALHNAQPIAQPSLQPMGNQGANIGQAISAGDSDSIWSIGLCHGAVTTSTEGRTCLLSAPVVTDIDSDGQPEVLIGGLSDGYLYAIKHYLY